MNSARVLAWLAQSPRYKMETLSRRASALTYKTYCKVRGYDFDGFVAREALDGADKTSLGDATAYQPYPVQATIALVERALNLRPEANYFVDVGCGKGKQCHYVAKRFRFGEIVGVDFSPGLIAIARRNLEISGQRQTHYSVADATEWRLPDRPSIVFMYNPFGAEVMKRFIENNRAHFAKHGSVIAYGNDTQRQTIENSGFAQVFRSETLNNSLYVLKP